MIFENVFNFFGSWFLGVEDVVILLIFIKFLYYFFLADLVRFIVFVLGLLDFSFWLRFE